MYVLVYFDFQCNFVSIEMRIIQFTSFWIHIVITSDWARGGGGIWALLFVLIKMLYFQDLYYSFCDGLKTINEIFCWEFYGKTFKLPIETKFDFLKIIKEFRKDSAFIFY